MTESGGGRPDNPGDGPHAQSPRELQSIIFAERELEPFIYFRGSDGELVIRKLTDTQTVTIGRHDSNAISLSFDSTVSGIHAELEPVGEEWILQDDGLSTNGTLLNGVQVVGRRRLRDGDVLRFGETSIVFRSPGISDQLATGTPGDQQHVEITPAQRKVLLELCRPVVESEGSTPAGNQEIADRLFLSVETVKTHVKDLYSAFDLEGAEPRAKRPLLVTRAQAMGLIRPSDYRSR